MSFRSQHQNPNDDLQLILSYMDIDGGLSKSQKLASCLRSGRPHGLSVGIDLKRRSPTEPSFRCDFSDPAAVASAFLDCHADFVFANCDFSSYGGELNDIKQVKSSEERWFERSDSKSIIPPSTQLTTFRSPHSSLCSSQIVATAQASFPSSAVVFKDIIIDPLQLALAKQLNCDAALVLACVVGSELPGLLDIATLINLPVIVECHTEEEVKIAVENGGETKRGAKDGRSGATAAASNCVKRSSHVLHSATTNNLLLGALLITAGVILLNRVDRFSGNAFYPDQPFAIRNALPPGNIITTLVTGRINDDASAQSFLDAGFDGVVMGSSLVGNANADKLIRSIKDLEMGEVRSDKGRSDELITLAIKKKH